MTDDIQAVYERVYRSLLWRLRPRRLQMGVQWLIEKAHQDIRSGTEPQLAFARAHARARERVIGRMVRGRQAQHALAAAKDGAANRRVAEQTRAALDSSIPAGPVPDSPDFHCDCGLGGLARWLRAAGYDARFWPRIDDDEIIQETVRSHAILLTTDGPLMSRSAVAWGVIPALLVPLAVGKHEQFKFVSQRLGLPRKASRCMACGGSLEPVDKESVRERIPPRTYPWRDDYCECRRCGKLLWHGTHWQNVDKLLERALEPGQPPGPGR